MRVTVTEKQQYWEGHVAAVERYGGSHGAYCRGEGISSPALWYWRNKVRRQNRSRSPVPVQSFVPVEVTCDGRVRGGLPDPRWLAELIVGLSGGAR